MKTFRCQCDNRLHFENISCLSCERPVGFLPDERLMSALVPVEEGGLQALLNNKRYRYCQNATDYDVCNWLVPVSDNNPFCISCRLNQIIPDLGKPQNIKLWLRIESAKKRLLYTLQGLNLPVVSRKEDPTNGLGFEFLEDESVPDAFSGELTIRRSIISGHNAGMITINLLEADHGPREKIREQMNELYRTLLGHFRHESGHYYWDRLINDSRHIDSFRELFGDERWDYQNALRRYYKEGPPEYWQTICISAYATSHPWEDWAETWAHYLHMIDTLETAHDFGFTVTGHSSSPKNAVTQQATPTYLKKDAFSELFNDWMNLTVALNALNRSMGMKDAYPFIVSDLAFNKLRYIHQIICTSDL